uniref:ArsA/GET3 Anion-transporting ATPase-like domain-containing protein n=1 Tax=Lygus hesperus TaxID=30085 RepID=A0A0A9X698_LYGHE
MANANLVKIDESTKKKPLAKSLNNVYEDEALKWIFVGGKGGVGKTTCSCSLALRLAQVRRSVLLISTDPAHNVSHAFDQKFGRAPTKVNGVENLFVMEMDPKGFLECFPQLCDDGTCPSERVSAKSALAEFFGNVPGIDETLAYAEIMKMAHSSEFSVVVFDTAPTGHTLRLLSFPAALEAFFTKVIGLRDRFLPLLTMFQNFQSVETESLTEILTIRAICSKSSRKPMCS